MTPDEPLSLHWHDLPAAEQPALLERLWTAVCDLRDRYRLPLRSRWWEDQIQVEALTALVAWVARYDSGEWDDPPGKLALLFELERVQLLLRTGHEPFDPERDRGGFDRHLAGLCAPACPTGVLP